MQLPEARLHLVADPSDRPEHTQFIKSLAASLSGRVVCEIRLERQGRLSWLAETMLQALGKKPNRAGHGRNAQLSWRRAIIWSVAQDVRHLFVSRAQLLHARDIENLLDLAALADADLWLIVQGERLRRPAREALAQLPLRRWSYPSFKEHWRTEPQNRTRPAKAKKRKSEVPRYQHVPDDEFPTFLAACDELLSATQARAVEHDFVAAADKVEAWLEETPDIESTALASFLLKLVDPLPSRAAMVVAIRAAQVVLFARSHLLKVDVERLLAKRESLPDIERAPELAVLASSYADPNYPAQASLCLVLADHSLNVIPNLNLAHIASGAETVRVSEASVDIPEPLQPFLAGQRLLRLFEGAEDGDPLFVSEGKAEPGRERPLRRRSWHGIQQAARKVASETGIPLVLRYSGTSASTRERWNYGLGISLQPLAPLVRSPRGRRAS